MVALGTVLGHINLVDKLSLGLGALLVGLERRTLSLALDGAQRGDRDEDLTQDVILLRGDEEHLVKDVTDTSATDTDVAIEVYNLIY